MQKWLKRSISLGSGLFLTGKINPAVVPYAPQKVRVSGYEEKALKRSYPERVGVSSGRILAMLKALERERRANIHSLVIVKDGVVISECSHPGYDVNLWHLSHSMSKTLTGIAIGMLVDDGLLSLDEKLIDIFPDEIYKDARFEDITVYHLITMTSGVRFSELGSVSESKWTDAFFESEVAFVPGEDYSYNSMNSYILAKIVKARSGLSLTDILGERLFRPLGIDNYFWELGPEGEEKGGWGVYLSAESWAKIGLMMLSGGAWGSRRILSEDWIREATKIHAKTPDAVGPYDYGYHLWVARDGGSYLFNGMFGQNVWVCPANNIVVSLNSGNNELFQDSPAMAVIVKYLGLDLSEDLHESCFSGDLLELREAEEHFFESRHWVRPAEARRGLSYALGLRSRTPYPEEWDEIIGKYHFTKNNYGIFPLILRVMQNNLRSTLDGVELSRVDDRIFFTFTEGGVPYSLEVGFYDFKTTVVDYHGERYIVKVIGEAMEDEDRNMLFKIELLFPELPNTRMIKLSFTEDGSLLFRMSEMPNYRIADTYIADLSLTNPALDFVFGLFEKRVGGNLIKERLKESFAPTLIGARVGVENYVEIMDKEREKLRASEKTEKLIDAVVKRFFHDADIELDCEMEKPKSRFSTFIGDIVDRFKARFPDKKKTPKGIPEKTDSAFFEEVSAESLPALSPDDFGDNDAENGEAL